MKLSMLKTYMPLAHLACYWRLARVKRAFLYATGTLDTKSARRMLAELEEETGFHALESISAEEILERLLERYENFHEMVDIAYAAASIVSDGWETSDEIHDASVEMALTECRLIAQAMNVPLIPIKIDEHQSRP